jgi:hypothetical protein
MRTPPRVAVDHLVAFGGLIFEGPLQVRETLAKGRDHLLHALRLAEAGGGGR